MLYVDGEPLSAEAVDLEFNRLVAFYREHQPGVDLDALKPELMDKAREQAVGSILLLHEARHRGIEVAPERVDAKFREMIDSCGGKEAFMRMVERKSLELETLRDAVISGLLVDELVRMITADVAKPTEREVQEYYDLNRAAFQTPEKIRTRHILLKLNETEATGRAIAEARLDALADEIGQGADFADLAALHSECPSGREAGGMIGWIARGTVLPAIETAVFGLEKNGQLSRPVETPLGLHLFQCMGRKPSQPATYEEAHDRIMELLRHVRHGERLSEFVAILREQAVIDDRDSIAEENNWDDESEFDFDE